MCVYLYIHKYTKYTHTYVHIFILNAINRCPGLLLLLVMSINHENVKKRYVFKKRIIFFPQIV